MSSDANKIQVEFLLLIFSLVVDTKTPCEEVRPVSLWPHHSHQMASRALFLPLIFTASQIVLSTSLHLLTGTRDEQRTCH